MKFGIERDLQRALCLQIEQMEPGLKITDAGKKTKVAAGWIDITAEDQNGAAVVIELKAGEADRDAIGQILGYMGDMALENKVVRGILVAGDFAPRAIAAARVVPNLRLEKYSFNFAFTAVK
jgi:RecB family endonuclease NucS